MIFTAARALRLLLLCLPVLPSVSANVEKEIFVAPHAHDELLYTGANDGQSVELEALHLGLPKLTPSSLCGTDPCRSLKTTLNTSFLDNGERQWILLDHLKPGRRYEVRICWAATAPPSSRTVDEVDHAVDVPRSLLYLEIQAKAAYYTPDKSRMENPDSVDVEIILDPFFMNVVPESLFPIAGMITLVALFAWWASGQIYKALQAIATTENKEREKKDS